MLSYQHIYHAGNFADVHKHALLVKTLTSLKTKAPQLFLLDTHAGRGVYDLTGDEAQKKQEFKNGITTLWKDDNAASPLADYLALVKKYNSGDTLDTYPGSSEIAKTILRAGDRLVFTELHPGEFEKLQSHFGNVTNVTARQSDGFKTMADSVPPPERKGIVVIDPPYEIKTDYVDVPRNVGSAVRKWPQGVFFIWYPILTSQPHLQMLIELRKTAAQNVLISEVKMETMPKEGFAMYGSGIAIVNCPLPEQAVASLAQYLCSKLPSRAFAETYWLDNARIDQVTGKLEY